MAQMLRDVLSRPLADVPITYPLAWGMPAPFEETPGQVLNAWLELIPAGMFTSSYAAGQVGRPSPPGQLWLPEENTRIVHFLGFDNAYYFTMTHMALLMAQCTQFVRPEHVLTNEFYELENEKFSTSKQHVLSVQTILTERPRDIVRLYLASTAPEYQRTSFSRSGLAKLVDDRLVGPWNRLVQNIAGILSPGAPERLPVSDLGRRQAALMLERFDFCYEMPNYSLTRVADTILTHIARLSRVAGELADVGAEEALNSCGDLLLQVQALLALAAPVLIDLAEQARQDGGFTGVLEPGAFEVADIAAFVPPRLSAVAEGDAVDAPAGLGELAGATGLAEVG
jgi:methionyl-tRNA synthetase